MKQKFIPSNKSGTVSTQSIQVGECFKFDTNRSPIYLRIAPVDSFFKSKMISEIHSRGDVFAVNLNTGEFTCFSRNLTVVELKAEFETIKN